MLATGLSAADQRLFEAQLRTHHDIRITMHVLDTSHVFQMDVSGMLEDGQVNVDAAAENTRQLSCSLFDPEHMVGFDSTSPATGALYLDRMINVKYGVYVIPLLRWVDVDVFTGPVTKASRDRDVISVEASGKEELSLDPLWTGVLYQRGTLRTTVLRDVLARTGETRFDLLTSTTRQPADYAALVGEDTSWGVAQKVAVGMACQLYYDARGVARLRGYPGASTWTFNTGDGGCLKNTPQLAFQSAEVFNAVRVIGATPSAGLPPTATAVAPSNHPLSPSKLGRNGKPRYKPYTITDDSLVTKTQCQSVANSALSTVLMDAVDIAFDSIVIPHLEPQDVVTVATDDYVTTIRATKFSIPLNAAGAMSVGYLKKVTTKSYVRRKR